MPLGGHLQFPSKVYRGHFFEQRRVSVESCKEGIKAWGWRVSRRRPSGEAGGIGLAGLLPMVKVVKKTRKKTVAAQAYNENGSLFR